MKDSQVWFSRSMWLGFVATNFFALPGIFFPVAAARLMGAPAPSEPVWLAFAFLLSHLVSWFYIPAAIDPLRYLPTAYLSVAGRFATVLFWLCIYPYYEPGASPWIWKLDLAFGVIQLVLLIRTVRTPSVPTA